MAVPVTLLSGFLGAGKTTLLQHILKNKEGLRCAVLVNDMASVNIDASLISNTRVLQETDDAVELHNGCICCSLRMGLYNALHRFATEGSFDVIVVESTGVANPMDTAETFFLDPPNGGPRLNTLCRLDNCVTVVDASTFAGNLRSVQEVADKFGPSATPDDGGGFMPGSKRDVLEATDDDRNVAHLLADQVEFANLVVLNKTDLVDQARVDESMALIRALNPKAKVVTARRSAVDVRFLLQTNKFSEDYAAHAKSWMAGVGALGCGSAAPPQAVRAAASTEQCRFTSFVYRAARPFHPQRLHDFMTRYFLLQELSEIMELSESGGSDEDASCETAAAAAAAEAAAAHLDEEENDEEPRRRCGGGCAHGPPAGGGAAGGGAARAVDEEEQEQRRRVMETLAARQAARQSELGSVLRSKGYVWVGSPSRLGGFGEWNHAGNMLTFSYGGGWGMFPDPAAGFVNRGQLARAHIDKSPSQEVVFIGQKINQDAIEAQLNECLLTAAEDMQLRKFMVAHSASNPDDLALFPDPFEMWSRDDAPDDNAGDAGKAAAEAADAHRQAAAAAQHQWTGGGEDDEEEDDEDGGLK